MDNPSLILHALDQHLKHEVRLVIYGRAALWLGFDGSPPEAAKSQDVDAIISTRQENELSTDHQFWNAIEATNVQLATQGLYITHLFSEREVFLRKQWQNGLVPITRLQLRSLQLFRPATIDLVLTKMMRGDDPQDMDDAAFMIRLDRISETQLTQAFSEMNPIEMIELREAFARAKPIVLKHAREFAS